MSFEEKLFGGPYKKGTPEIINENAANHQPGSGHSIERDPESEHTEQQFCTGFDTILKKLEEDPENFQVRIEQLKHLPDCSGILPKFEPYFTEEHWKMTATLEAYDKITFEHSLRVAAFVYDMANGGGATETYLKEHVKMEKSSLEELFTAALLHDIGKTAIPNEILHDNHSRREWGKRANEWAAKNTQEHYFDPSALETLDDVELDAYFMQMHAMNDSDPLNIVPIEEIFKPDILTDLAQHGISRHDTFRKVLECHEKATRAILRRSKMYVASDIASHHHDYDGKPIRSERYQTETSAIRLGFELSILRSIDVYDALTSDDRSYKKPFHPLLALEILIREAQAEFTELELTKYIVRDLYEKEMTHTKKDFSILPAESREAKARQKILTFIGN